MNKVFIGDNISYFDKKYIKNKAKIIYIDPPYNTNNIFSYNDKEKKDVWKDKIEQRIKKLKKFLKDDGVFICSINEESLFEFSDILKNNFKYLFEPLVWLTKEPLNQNKITNISSICHEYILIASDQKVVSKYEEYELKNVKDEIIKNKLKRYPLKIELLKDIDEYETFKTKDKDKEIVRIKPGEYKISKNIDKSFKNHCFQKRTAQKGHGSYRYIQYTKQDPLYSEQNLYFIKGVKDKYELNGKFILDNSYFQSISSVVKLKLPSFLGFYQNTTTGFQTAKPIPLIERIFKVFSDKNDFIIDVYGGSGNVCIAADNLELNFYTFEQGTNEEMKNGSQGSFILNNLKKNNIVFQTIKEQ